MVSYTANKGFGVPTVGADYNLWGNEINTDLGILDTNLGGQATINCAGNSNVTATTVQAQNMALTLTGALTGNIEVILPAVGSFYVVNNQTTGPYSVTVLTSAGGSTGISAPQGVSQLVWSDGTNIYGVSPGWVTLSNANYSASSGVSFILPPSFSRFRMTLQNISFAINGDNLSMEFSVNGGASFPTGNYSQLSITTLSSASTPGIGWGASFNALAVTGAGTQTGLSAGTSGSLLEIWPGTTSSNPVLTGTTYGLDADATFFQQQIYGSQLTIYTINYLTMFTAASGTFSGTIILEGLAQ